MQPLESTIIEFDVSARTYKTLDVKTFEINPHEKNKIYWIHCNLSEVDLFQAVAAKIHLPEVVVSACNNEDNMPKLIETDNALTLQVQCILYDTHEEDFGNLIIHLSEQYCFTATYEALPALTEFFENYPKAVKYAKTPCFILFLLLDNTVNDYAKNLYDLEMKADEMDLLIRQSAENAFLDVANTKNYAMKIKRYATTVREMLMRISGRRISVISEQCRVSLFNLFSHCQMVVHEADSVRDMLNSLLDQIDNALMQRMNETMRVLTAFAAIFLPLTLITGIYGMNFEWMPELHWRYGYLWALFLIILCAAFLLIVFKRKKWF